MMERDREEAKRRAEEEEARRRSHEQAERKTLEEEEEKRIAASRAMAAEVSVQIRLGFRMGQWDLLREELCWAATCSLRLPPSTLHPTYTLHPAGPILKT